MKPYILTKRNSIHIIDPKETLKGLLAAKKFLARIVAEGKDVLMVGTKRQARRAIEENAQRAGMPYVTDRWLGGTLTNFRTIRSRLARLEKLEQLDAEGLLGQHSKKEDARLRREMRKIRRNLEGIRNMERLPGAVFVVDAHREIIGLREARKLGIPTLALIVAKAIELAKAQRSDKAEPAGEGTPPRRTRRRVTARAHQGNAAPAEGEQSSPADPSSANASGTKANEQSAGPQSDQGAPAT